MNLRCENCEFDLSEFDADISFTLKDFENVNPADPSGNLYCPLCGSIVPLRLAALGVVVRRDVVAGHASLRFIQWIAKGEKIRPGQVVAGRLTIGFVRSSDGPSAHEGIVEAVDPADIFYKMVPAFRDRNGTPVVPTLPIRSEYFDLVDVDAINSADGRFEPGHIEAGMYRARIPLKGREAPWPVSVRVMPSRLDRSPSAPEQDAFRGVSLSVWPDVPYREWNFFRTELRVHDDDGLDLLAKERAVSIGVVGGREGFRALAEQREDGRGFFDVSTTGRPEWLSIAFEGAQPAGGVFRVWPQAEPMYLQEQYVDIALDIGTSNTCTAFRGADGDPVLMPIRDLRRVVFDGSATTQIEVQSHPDTAPPRRGFGVHGDLLPSEVLFRKGGNLAALKEALSRVNEWVPFLDYTIPSAGVRPAFDEASSIFAEFKVPVDPDSKDPGLLADPEVRFAVLRRYAVALLLDETAHALSQSVPLFVPGRNFTIKYSYPGVLPELKERLSEILKNAAAEVSRFTGVTYGVEEATADEARAAGRNVEGGIDGIRVYVDMGGGSTDIAMYYQRGTDPNPDPVYLTSVRYAGSVALKAMCGEGEKPLSCLHPGITIETLRRGIREATRLSDLIKNPLVFPGAKASVRNRRTGLYFGYLMEYLARLLAAAFLSGDYLKYVRRRTEQEPTYPDPFEIELILIGNGWGFLAAIDDGTPALVARLVQARTLAILKEALADEAVLARVTDSRGRNPLNVQMKFILKDLQQLFRGAKAHAKAAVAFGLLKADAGGRRDEIPRSTIVGLSTLVDGQHCATWDMPVRTGDDAPVSDFSLSSASSLTWDLSEVPSGWRQLNLLSPEELDPSLGETRSTMWRYTLPKAAFSRWFTRSPFEVVMEQLFAKRIPREGA